MRIGELTTPVTVKRSTGVRDAYGHDTLTYSTLYDPLMVAVDEAPQTMVDGDAEGRSRRTVARFTAAWTPDLDIQPRDIIVWQDEDYEVETFFNKLGRNRFVELTAVRLARA